MKISVNRSRNGRSVHAARTLAGSCPIYVAADGGTLVASWRFEDAVLALREVRPNAQSCRIFLEHGPSQVREQVVGGVFMLWPGESMSFDDDGLRFRQADDLDIVVPATFADSARATDEFLRLLAECLEPSLSRSAYPLLEVSGGFDSACVAVAARSVRAELSSYGIILDGAVGAQQQRRRRELIELLGSTDFEFPGSRFPPFATLDSEECALTPFDEMYRLACGSALDGIAEGARAKVDLLVAGIGGDELTFENTFRREQWEVRGSICSSSVVAAACRADMFMRRGIWTSNPCTAQSVVDFCRALPKKIRQNRLLNILTLARAGLSDGFLFPRYFENFGNIFLRDAATYDFDQALTDSVLHEYRVCDVSSLLAEARDSTLDGFSHGLATKLFLLVKLEKVLGRYVG